MAEVKTNISFGGSIPKIYDDVLGPVYFEPYAVDMAKRVAALNPAATLEVAAGTGRVTVHLTKALNNAKLTATDINPDMLAIAQGKVKNSNVQWQVADATALPFNDNSFDVVVAQFGVMFYPDKLQGFKEALRVLKKGGTFLFNVWDSVDVNHFSHTGREVVMNFFENDPPAFFNIPYSMSDISVVKELLTDAGFTELTHEVMEKECVIESAEVMSSGLVEGNPIATAIRERDPEAIPVLKKKVKETLVQRFGDHPCHTTMQAIIFSAKKQ